MSYVNPTITEVLSVTKPRKYKNKIKLGRSCFNAIKGNFRHQKGYNPTLDDAEELLDLCIKDYYFRYVIEPERLRIEKQNFFILLKEVKQYNIDVKKSAIRFLSPKDVFKDYFRSPPKTEGIPLNGCCTYIVENNLIEEWKSFAVHNKQEFKYYRPTYQDFSHLAYNGVTDDF